MNRHRVVGGGLQITRRHLPHWQSGGATYFVTFRTRNLELSPAARKVVLEAILHFDQDRYTLWATVVMPDHVHMIIQPAEIEPGLWGDLGSITHSLKSYTAKQINRVMRNGGHVWQDERFDRIVRDEAELREKILYIRNNPMKRDLCSSPDEWDAAYESPDMKW